MVGLDEDFESRLKNGVMSVSISGRRGIQNWLDGASVCKKKEKEEGVKSRRTSKEEGRGENIRAKKICTKKCTRPAAHFCTTHKTYNLLNQYTFRIFYSSVGRLRFGWRKGGGSAKYPGLMFLKNVHDKCHS